MNATFENLTDRTILLFNSSKKYIQKELYSYLPKLNKILNTDDYEELLKKYVVNGLTPELNYLGEIDTGDYLYIDLSINKFVYSFSMKTVNGHPYVSIDIATLYNEYSYKIISSENTKIKNIISRIKNKSVNEISGITEHEKYYTWELTRHPYSYIHINSEAVLSKSGNSHCRIILFIIIFLVCVIITIAYVVSYMIKSRNMK